MTDTDTHAVDHPRPRFAPWLIERFATGRLTVVIAWSFLPLVVPMLLAPFGILVYFTLMFSNAFLVYFALLAALPAAIIALTAKTPREFVLALQLTTLTAFGFGVGLGAAIAF